MNILVAGTPDVGIIVHCGDLGLGLGYARSISGR